MKNVKSRKILVVLLRKEKSELGGKVIVMKSMSGEQCDGSDEKIGYCGNHCTYCFFDKCPGCRSNNPFCSYATLFDNHKCPNVTCCKGKGFEGCWQCSELENCAVGFFSSGQNDAKAYALFIRKYGKEKYTQAIISLKKAGYDYPKQFKNINNVKQIYQIFEQSLKGAK